MGEGPFSRKGGLYLDKLFAGVPISYSYAILLMGPACLRASLKSQAPYAVFIVSSPISTIQSTVH